MMKVAAALSGLAPKLIQSLASTLSVSMPAEDATECATALVDGLVDAVHAGEVERERAGKQRFIVEAATHVLHGWAGEPTEAAGREAVRIVVAMLDEAERAMGKP